MDMSTIATSVALITISTLFLGSLLSDRLPDIDKRFDRKPFNCRPCLTFHLTWLMSALLALVSVSWQLFATGVAGAFIIFAILKFIDNKKIEK